MALKRCLKKYHFPRRDWKIAYLTAWAFPSYWESWRVSSTSWAEIPMAGGQTSLGSPRLMLCSSLFHSLLFMVPAACALFPQRWYLFHCFSLLHGILGAFLLT